MVIFSLSFLFLLSILSLSLSQAIWEAQYYDSVASTTPLTSLTIKRGAFTPLFIKFSLIPGKTMTRVKGSLSLTPKTLTISDSIVVNTYMDRLIKVFIGIPCNSQEESENIKFQVDGATEFVTFPDLQATILKEETQFEVKPLITSTMTEGIGFYQINGETYNVDEIQISFTVTDGLNTVDPFTLAKFNGKRNSESLLQGKFITTKNQGLFTYPIVSSNKCFVPVNNKLSFDVIERKYPTAAFDKAALINSFTHQEDINSLTIKFNVPNETVVTSCAAFSSYASVDNVFDLTKPELKAASQNHNFRLARTVSYSATPTEQTLQFQNINRLGTGFVIRCIIMNGVSTLTDKDKVEFSIGSSTQQAYEKRIKITLDLPSPSQCGIWTLKTGTTEIIKDLTSKVKDYCEKSLANHNIEQKIDNLNDNGCIQCEEYSPSEPNQFGLCIRSLESCPSNFEKGKNTFDFFRGITSSLDTKDKLISELNPLLVDEVLSVLHQNYEEVIPNDNTIKAEVIDKSKVKFSSSLERDIQCVTTTKLSLETNINNEKQEDMTTIFDSPVIILKSEQSIEYTYQLEPLEDGLYQIILQCSNYPNYQYHYKNFLILADVMVWTSQKIPTIAQVEPFNCSSDDPEPTFTGQCVEHLIFHLELDSKDIIPDIDKITYDFSQITFEEKIIYLDIENGRMKVETTNKELILNRIGLLSKLVSSLICLETHNYVECRKNKQKHIVSLYEKLQEAFPPANQLEETLKTFTNQEQAAFLFAFSLYQISNSPESYNDRSYAEFPPLASKYIHQMPKVFSELKISTIIKGDIARLISGYVVNGNGYAKYFNEEKGAKSDDLGVYTEPNIIQIKNDFEIAHRLLVYGGIKNLDLDYLSVLFVTPDDVKDEEQSKTFVFFGGEVNMSIPVEIYTNPQIDLVGLIVFSDYFLFSTSSTPYLTNKVYGVRYYLKTEEQQFQTNLDINSAIYVDHFHKPDMFKKFRIEKNFKSFEYSNIGSTEASGEVALFEIARDGDYVIGRNEGSVAWMIVTFALVGSILIAGIAYFIYANVKRRTQTSQFDAVAPILQEK